MPLLRSTQAKSRAGRSALERFNAQRWKAIRRNWRDWLGLSVVSIGSIAAIVLLQGTMQLIAAGILGATLMMALVGWVVGDVYSHPWLWGALGERQTAGLLGDLDQSWICEHDLLHERGNWDHVAIGRAGVFLIDTKRVTRPAVVADDTLLSGRIRSNGASFRGAAAGLSAELERRCGTKPWVRAVVVIWGDFPQRCREENRVTYLGADELLGWLRGQPSRLNAESTRRLGDALHHLARTRERQVASAVGA
jgi:hypothetical protein